MFRVFFLLTGGNSFYFHDRVFCPVSSKCKIIEAKEKRGPARSIF